MDASNRPEWVVREDASAAVIVALYLRHVLGVRSPEELPSLRDVPPAETTRSEDEQATLDRQWRAYWAMTVEPQAHPSPVPLDLVAGFETYAALPVEGFAELHAAISPYGAAAVAYARAAADRYSDAAQAGSGSSYRAYASAIAQHERQIGRRAHSFELNVQILPLSQRGVWWIGSLTIAVTDRLRTDVVAFDAAVGPIIADIA